MSTPRASLCLVIGAIALARCVFAADVDVRVLDRFDDVRAWTALSSDQVTASLRAADAGRGGGDKALCLDFDFHGVSGYAAMRRKLPIDYPPNYEFTFRVRGDAAENALQFKLADASGDNVWWVNHPDFMFPREWQDQHYKKRQIDFAWGPSADRMLHHSESVEFTIYAGKGGRGEVCFDQLSLRRLPPAPATWPKPVASASSSLPDAPAAQAIDGNPATAWRSDPGSGAEQMLTLDLGTQREFGGLVLHWLGDAFASSYEVELSDDARAWRRVRVVTAGNGGTDPLYLPESEARYLRLALHDGPKKSYELGEIEIRDLAFGATANAFFSELAKMAPRGAYPRGFYDEQTYWTVVGIDGGHETGLLSEDGAVEVARGGFSIEPFLVDEAGKLSTWADMSIAHSLRDGYLPIPSVEWKNGDLGLTTTVFGDGTADSSRLIASYTLENRSERPRTITLALALRPFQVNPSVQFLNTPGGVSPIHDLALSRGAIRVDGKPRAFLLAPPTAFRVSPFDAGMAAQHLVQWSEVAPVESNRSPSGNFPRGFTPREAPRNAAVTKAPLHDDSGLASGALLYRIALAPHASQTIGLSIPLDGAARMPPLVDRTASAKWIAARSDAVATIWHTLLDRVTFRVPASAQPLADTLRSALADILISRDGAAIRPGTRAYARSWIRDGTMISEALLRLGHADAARAYLDWYAPYQFRNGKVPCCVDARGSDPVPENDSHGELIHLAHEVYRYTGDRASLQAIWPHIDAAARYMDELRASERTPANRPAGRDAFHGLMPASISHEGYSAKPMHSYWDDFWALTGYDDVVDIAGTLGRDEDASHLRAARDEFRDDLYASIRIAVAAHRIDYLPGCAELGDFDPTSTTIALSPAGQQMNLPQDLLHATFERYWKNFVERRDRADWKDYTPYEWRTVGSFVRFGWRERAQQASDFFMRDRRPAGWNQWAEVVGRNPRESRFIGDMPHGWVASDFIRATLDRFAYERVTDRALVLAAGVPPAWLDGDGIAIEGLRTPYGRLDYTLKRSGNALHLHIGSTGMKTPPGGFIFAWPGSDSPGPARLDGHAIGWHGNELRFDALPADLVVATTTRQTP